METLASNTSHKLTEMTNPWHHRYWGELEGDSLLGSVRYAFLGWVPRKRERVTAVRNLYGMSVLRKGSTGTYRDEDTGELRHVTGPGVFFVVPGQRNDYGPADENDCWTEYYWALEGARVQEWLHAGWWKREARFWPVSAEFEAQTWALFTEACSALDARNTERIDKSKLALERLLSEAPWVEQPTVPNSDSPLAPVVEMWRRDVARDWSLTEAAQMAGLSYTRFRARFVAEYGCAPYTYLLGLRMEIARQWLRFTTDSVKMIATRCGFCRVEPFIRAFARSHGLTPARWREREARLAPITLRKRS